MYSNHFDLKAPVFSIAPDPQYLFLSAQHREALAHLLYGAEDNGGFVLLTGEVGTGKTTVCRAFLEQLPAGVEVALILNPTQTAEELLLTLCTEFAIPVVGSAHSLRALVEFLNQYLLTAHAAGRRPLLVIDEAQNLKPEVLEQIRLLTNLETNTHKLLQIFLIGQPELRRLLDTEQLRQLNQRITARFHLTPFTRHDTGNYIRHRLAVAGIERPLFTARAIHEIHRHSGGIPRLINILCERALLGASVTRRKQITPHIVTIAASEVRGDAQPTQRRAHPLLLAAAVFTLSLGAGWFGYQWVNTHFGNPIHLLRAHFAPPAESSIAPIAPIATSVSTPAPAPLNAETALNLEQIALPEAAAFRLLLRQWGQHIDSFDEDDPCNRVTAFGLSCVLETGTLANLRYFDLPALLRVTHANGRREFLVLLALGEREATLALETGTMRISVAALERFWTGNYTLIWQPPPGGAVLIAAGSAPENVRWLRRRLAQVTDLPSLADIANDAPIFDAPLAAAVRVFQASRGLEPDGVAGARTLIQLNRAAAVPNTPSLTATAAP
ncbi:peptidoglycan-binding protein [Chromatium weissei]|nr:peptidoglycan-binding protein [Chromatium weissei]